MTLSDVTLDHNRTLDNSSNSTEGDGGAIYHLGDQLTITNSTISNNVAETGGGIYLGHGTGTLNNVTITQNVATSAVISDLGGGIYAPTGLSISNTIVAGNAGGYSPDCWGNITSGGHNLIGTNSGCQFTSASGDVVGSYKSPVYANLGPLSDNGGSTQTHALLTGSQAIDAGDPATCSPTDQRGISRPQGAVCDIGAFEGSVAQAPSAVVRTYTAHNAIEMPGDLVCDQSSLANCIGDTDAYNAENNILLFYQFVLSKVGRAGLDGNNLPIIATVHFDAAYDNSYWDGTQIVLGDAHGYANAKNVIGHELTHGITQYGSSLFDYYQSGAIDESIADIWGQFFEQANGAPGDWQIGEDVTGLTAFRDMSNPPLHGDPDRMLSPLYDFDQDRSDNGGIHHNSGINNKAAYLMTVGGTFNKKKVTALGADKTLAIYYEVQMNLLTSGADYLDLYNALYQGCLDLVGGSQGITTGDCQQVRNATDAVQMNLSPKSTYNPEVSYCPAGMTKMPSDLFYDGFENGLGNWTLGTNTGNQRWSDTTFYSSAGEYSLYGSDYDPQSGDQSQTSDTFAAMANGVSVPSGSTPYLYFMQAFGFEYDGHGNYDGGVLEYSTDDGTTWNDAKPLFNAGVNYGGKLYTITNLPDYLYYNNPLHGRFAFVKDSHGYISSRYKLTSLAGKTVKFRFRLGTDILGYGDLGWNVDDVRIYTCVPAASVPVLSLPVRGSLITNYQPTLNWKDATPADVRYQLQVAKNNTFASPLVDTSSLTLSIYPFTSSLDPNTTYYWHVRAFNIAGSASAWSATWSFNTAPLPPILSSPADGTHNRNLRPTFTWSDPNSPGVTGYTIQISKDSGFASILIANTSSATSFTPSAGLPIATKLYWRVRVNGPNGSSFWSPYRSYTTH